MVCQAIFDGLKVLGTFLSSEYRPSYPVDLYILMDILISMDIRSNTCREEVLDMSNTCKSWC